MRQHQKELLEFKMQELEERILSGNFNSKASESSKINLEKLKAYTPENFPVKSNPRNIQVDIKRNSVLLPINGQLVPFHISVLKNVTKHSESKMASLRFNFFTPGIAAGNITFPSGESYGNSLVYIKELTFRSSNVENYNQIAKDIKDVQKNLKNSQNGTQEASNERLNLANKLKFLNDIKMRPAMNGKKTPGQLTAYENGFRFTNKNTNENFDLALSNVKHAILQPCEVDMHVIIHFALKEKVVINKKDSMHVQFFTEVGLLTEDLNDPRRRTRGHDLDEQEEEELERQAREYYNKQFIEFCSYVEKHWKSSLKFDSPFLESGFHGSHAYNNVMILPTSHCFVSLIELPFLVIAYSDVELVSLERIDNKIKNFDMIVVFKDYTRTVQTITNIPKNKLDSLKAWLE
jgi:Xaa-Pro aminopeptidase